jgi:hypothetical protein
MKIGKSILCLTALIAVSGLFGCIGNTANGQSDNNPITSTQANQIAQEIYLIASNSLGTDGKWIQPPYTYSCSNGGTINVTALLPVTQSIANVTETLNNCNVNSVVFNGDISGSLTISQSFSASDTNSTSSQSYGGYLAGTVTTSLGNCQVNTSYEEETTNAGTISMISSMIYGTVCNQPITLATFDFAPV